MPYEPSDEWQGRCLFGERFEMDVERPVRFCPVFSNRPGAAIWGEAAPFLGAADARFDAIVLDMNLPVGDGRD
jgi:hypothetical protein